MMLERIKGEIGMRLHGVQLNVDLVDFCPLHCPSCAVGSIGRRPVHYMDPRDFRLYLDRLSAQTMIRSVQLYVYSDPCMHPRLHEFVEACRFHNLPCSISTVLQQHRCDYRKVIEARPAEFRISYAGFDDMGYYQRGATPERFKENFAKVVSLPRYSETTWTLCYHVYKKQAKTLSDPDIITEDLVWNIRAVASGMKYVALPAIFMPNEKFVEKSYSPADRELISHLIETPEEAVAGMRWDKHYCYLWKQITLDARGHVYLCQLVYENRFRIGHIMEDSLKTLQKRMKSHQFCGKCLQAGGHAYQACYSDFVKYADPVGEADKRRRR